jgi:hypothetical protein
MEMYILRMKLVQDDVLWGGFGVNKAKLFGSANGVGLINDKVGCTNTWAFILILQTSSP